VWRAHVLAGECHLTARIPMIARTWHGLTDKSKADDYLDYLEESGVKEYRETEGNRGVYVLRRDEGDRTHFLLVSLWDSFDAIRRFAGPDMERAVYFPKDKEFLLEFEPNVLHYEVLVAPDRIRSASRQARSEPASRPI